MASDALQHFSAVSTAACRLNKDDSIRYCVRKLCHFAREYCPVRVVSRVDTDPNDLNASPNECSSPKSTIRKCTCCQNMQHEVNDCQADPKKKKKSLVL